MLWAMGVNIFYYLGLIWGYMGDSKECIGAKRVPKNKVPPLWGGIYLFIKGTEVRKRVPKNKVPPPYGVVYIYLLKVLKLGKGYLKIKYPPLWG